MPNNKECFWTGVDVCKLSGEMEEAVNVLAGHELAKRPRERTDQAIRDVQETWGKFTRALTQGLECTPVLNIDRRDLDATSEIIARLGSTFNITYDVNTLIHVMRDVKAKVTFAKR